MKQYEKEFGNFKKISKSESLDLANLQYPIESNYTQSEWNEIVLLKRKYY